MSCSPRYNVSVKKGSNSSLLPFLVMALECRLKKKARKSIASILTWKFVIANCNKFFQVLLFCWLSRLLNTTFCLWAPSNMNWFSPEIKFGNSFAKLKKNLDLLPRLLTVWTKSKMAFGQKEFFETLKQFFCKELKIVLSNDFLILIPIS